MPVNDELKAAIDEWEPQIYAKLNRASKGIPTISIATSCAAFCNA